MKHLLTALAFIAIVSTAEGQFNDKWASVEPAPQFLSATGLSGQDTETHFAWEDLDQDGFVDLVVARKQPFMTTGKRANVLLMNLNGVLTDQTATYAAQSDVSGDQGFLTPTNDRDVILTDVDGDGWADVVTACDLTDGDPKHVSHPRIYRNLGAGGGGGWQGLRFESARTPTILHANTALPVDPRFTAVAAGDLDQDSDNDLYFTDQDIDPGFFSPPQPPSQDSNDRLLTNDGFGFFSDTSATAMGPAKLATIFGNSAAIADMNGDGALDRLKQDGYQTQDAVIAYQDAGTPGRFSIQKSVYTVLPYYISPADLDNDGRLDVIITSNGDDVVLMNQGNDAQGHATFHPAKPFDFLAQEDDGFGSNHVVVDFDGDGWKDIFIPDVDPEIPGFGRRLHFYHNRGGTPGGNDITLREERSNSGPRFWVGIHGLLKEDLQATYDVAVFDVDNDNRLDLIISRSNGTQTWRQIEPPHCQVDLGFGDGSPVLEVCGGDLSTGNPADLRLFSAKSNATALLFASLSSQPTYVPELGATFAALPPIAVATFTTGPSGIIEFPIPGGGGPASFVIQAAVQATPNTWSVSNAIQVDLKP